MKITFIYYRIPMKILLKEIEAQIKYLEYD